ncbi:hypothetical protein BASA60_008896 [Batrachochytrium salamandrivorans]|nr:hypothetical protein BASA60_008896 [Batrachochytrium salamandrivorans]
MGLYLHLVCLCESVYIAPNVLEQYAMSVSGSLRPCLAGLQVWIMEQATGRGCIKRSTVDTAYRDNELVNCLYKTPAEDLCVNMDVDRRVDLNNVTAYAKRMHLLSDCDVMAISEWDAFMWNDPESWLNHPTCTLDISQQYISPRSRLVRPHFDLVGDSKYSRAMGGAYGSIVCSPDDICQELYDYGELRCLPSVTECTPEQDHPIKVLKAVPGLATLIPRVMFSTRPTCVWTMMIPWSIRICQLDLESESEAKTKSHEGVLGIAESVASDDRVDTNDISRTTLMEDNITQFDDDDSDFEPAVLRRSTRLSARDQGMGHSRLHRRQFERHLAWCLSAADAERISTIRTL